MKYALAAFTAGAVPLVPDGCGCGTATRALVKGCFCQCLYHIFPSLLRESNSKHGCGQQSCGRSWWHPCRGCWPRRCGVLGLLRQCHTPVCSSNATSALLMSFQTAISFKDVENLLIVLVHLDVLHLIKLEWRSRIGSSVRLQGRGGEGGQLLLSGGWVGRSGLS